MKKLIVAALTAACLIFTLTSAMAGGPDTATPSPYFYKNQISLGFFDDSIWAPNIDHPPSPIFWGASTKVDNGATLVYQRMIYHYRRWFSINLGTDVAYWERQNQSIGALSVFFAFRYWILRTRTFNPYFVYSVAGPTLITRRTLGPAQLGENFLFQDQMGFGAQIGNKGALNIEVLLLHYSNGDLFTQNSGLQVPVVIEVGFSFP